MEYDIHTILDGLTLAATCWVIYELWGPLKSTYQAEQDNIQAYYVVSQTYLLETVVKRDRQEALPCPACCLAYQTQHCLQ